MNKHDLQRRLGRLGFALFDADEFQVSETIAELVNSDDIRLWEGFPVVLANVSETRSFHFSDIKRLLKNKVEYKKFYSLFLITLALYDYLNLNDSWIKSLYRNVENNDDKKISYFKKQFKQRETLFVNEKQLDAERLEKVFRTYYHQNQVNDFQVRNDYKELSLEYAMSKIFTDRQKEIFLKRINGKKMTKTEKEYYYRIIKKKVLALANQELHELAKKAVL